MFVDEEKLKMLNEQYRAITTCCNVEGCFSNISAIELLHLGITHFLKQYQHQKALIPLLNAYFGMTRHIIDEALQANTDSLTDSADPTTHDHGESLVKATVTALKQEAIDQISRKLGVTESSLRRMRITKTGPNREYSKNILFTHDYTPKFEVCDTMFETITMDPKVEGPIYPPLKALSTYREEEVCKLLLPMLNERFAKIDIDTIGLFNLFTIILTFFEDNKESFFRSITQGYLTPPDGRQHNCYIDAINVTNLPTSDNIRVKYRYTVNGSKTYYQFRIEKPGCVEEFTLGKDENNEIVEIAEYHFTGCNRSITINLDRLANKEVIVQLSKFFIELAQDFNRRFKMA